MAERRIIDLTQTLRPGMRGVEFETKCTMADKGWNARTLHLYSHCGTHADAPWHFDVDDTTIDRISPDRFVGPAWVADAGEPEPRALLGVADLGPVAERVEPGDSLLIRTGWSRMAGRPEYYAAMPRLSDELAEWCAARRLNILGIEQQAVADPFDIEEIARIHKILLGAGILIVEGLTNLESITRERVTLVALPLKIEGGDGAPVRALAIEE